MIIYISCGQKIKTEKQTEKMIESSYPEEFDAKNLTKTDKQILADFKKRRNIFNMYLKENNIDFYSCPGCGYPTLSERGAYEICDVCNWEDDNQDDQNANENWGGPNSNLSLTENRLKIGRTLNCFADSLNGKINQNPKVFFEIYEKHRIRMNSIDENKLMNADINDPIWTEYKEKGKVILTDLVTE
ncbi:MAG TPA: CPCC family cysteine-rich protein [Edaphocola sp.]|nr:CPCC family cysteine-rich protein [Edaphocola sp.]